MSLHQCPNQRKTRREKNNKVPKDAFEKEFADIKEKRNNVW